MKTWKTWSLVVFCLLCARIPSVMAQPPEAVMNPDNYFILSERESGFWLSADALLWTRSNGGAGGTVIGGPEAVSFGNTNFSFEGGYRIGLGWLIDPNYEFEASWMQIDGWNATSQGYLAHAISFDGNASSAIIDPIPGDANFISPATFFRPLFDAATDDPGVPGGADDETTEYEFLQPGATYALRWTSNMSEGQMNFKTRRTQGRRFSIGLGYRHISLNEFARADVTGTFDAFDVDGSETVPPDDDDPNDQLSGAALTANGLTGAGDFLDPDLGGGEFSMFWTGTASNRLNGLQGVLDGTIIERDRFIVDGTLRAGIFLNRAKGSVAEQYIQTGGGQYGRSFSDESDGAAFAGSMGLNGSIRIADRCFLRAGYEFMVLTNVATAPAQQQGIVYNPSGAASYSVQASDNVVLQGLRAGIDFQW